MGFVVPHTTSWGRHGCQEGAIPASPCGSSQPPAAGTLAEWVGMAMGWRSRLIGKIIINIHEQNIHKLKNQTLCRVIERCSATGSMALMVNNLHKQRVVLRHRNISWSIWASEGQTKATWSSWCSCWLQTSKTSWGKIPQWQPNHVKPTCRLQLWLDHSKTVGPLESECPFVTLHCCFKVTGDANMAMVWAPGGCIFGAHNLGRTGLASLEVSEPS